MKRALMSTCYGVAIRKYPWVLLTISLTLVGVDILGVVIAATHVSALRLPAAMRSSFDLALASTQRSLFDSTYQAALPTLIVGILIGHGETQSTGHEYALIAEPRRSRLGFARLATAVLYGLIAAGICLLIVGISVQILLDNRSIRLAPGVKPISLFAANLAVIVSYAIVGCAVGMVIRSRVIALTGTLLWFLVVEALIAAVDPTLARWSIGEASRTLIQLDAFNITARHMLSTNIAATVLIFYIITGITLSVIVATHRDYG